MKKILTSIVFILSALTILTAKDGIIEGIVRDKANGETVVGVYVYIEKLSKGTTTDLEGKFTLDNIPRGKHTLKASFVGYSPVEIKDVEVANDRTTTIDIELVNENQNLDAAVVKAVKRTNSEVSVMSAMRTSTAVVSGVSSQQIIKTQDRNASEVLKRIPGISIIDNKFVIARGLSQRYNNVWINNSAVPSSEADSRAFSFDMIQSSQIDNIMIVKSPTPELPADFTGGFIKVTTKSMPTENLFQISFTNNINDQTQFHDFKYNKGSGTDFLGFDNGMRSLHNMPERMDNTNVDQVNAATRTGFNNNWALENAQPWPDQTLGLTLNRKFGKDDGARWGLIASTVINRASRRYADMENSRYGVYNIVEDKPDYINKYTDNQYVKDNEVGAIANITFLPNDKHKLEFRNMLNEIGRNRYTDRTGYQYTSGYYEQRKQEYLYTSRMTYSGQMAGSHTLSDTKKVDWTGGYSLANKNQPDRRIIDQDQNGFSDDKYYGLMKFDQNDISRDFIKIRENIYTLAANYSQDLLLGNFKPTWKLGVYGEYRNRNYTNRTFYYRYNADNLPEDFAYEDLVSQVLTQNNYGADKLYLYEDTDNMNSYSGTNKLMAAYTAFNIPLNKLNVYTGVRVERNIMTLNSYTRIKEFNMETNDYKQFDLFPSVNATYNLSKTNLVRAAYGASINRQEFREVSHSTYKDFDLFSLVTGNPDLKPAHIQNFDLRYEYYPSASELVSVAVFYKRFKNPIEMSFTETGGGYIYGFTNAEGANNYGLEMDIKKSLDFMGLRNFSFAFNGSLINSKMTFGANSSNLDRPMQGQSPYLINGGLFYQHEPLRVNMALLYNRIGKRIMGIGRKTGGEQADINSDVPDMYEMPRDALDFTISKRIGKLLELHAGVRNILNSKVEFKQFPKFIDAQGNLQERSETARSFLLGRTYSLAIKLNF